jgi:two-component system response regulator HydG
LGGSERIQPAEGPNHVLIVSDDESAVQKLAPVLAETNCMAVVAGTGDAARSCLAISVPRLILLDLDLPDGSAWSTFDQLRRHQPPIPIVLMSAGGLALEEGMRVGATAGVLKPLSAAFVRGVLTPLIEP